MTEIDPRPDAATGPPPSVLSIAGSDPSGGAGIQADLKTFSALGAYGMAAITALTAQNTRGVSGVHVVPAAFVLDQVEAILDDVRVDAIKLGMLANARIARAVGEVLDRLGTGPDERGAPYVVLDPVMVATSGDRLLDEDAAQAVRELMPRASIVTPNLAETAVLLDADPATDLDGLREQAQALRAAGAHRVLAKGGHLRGGGATDVFADEHGVVDLRGRRVDARTTHGTGCTLSSALAALRPRRGDWATTCTDAKVWLTDAIEAGPGLHLGRGEGHGPVHHFHALWGDR